MKKSRLKIAIGLAVFLAIPITSFAGFDKTDYYLGDTIYFDAIDFGNTADGESGYIYGFNTGSTTPYRTLEMFIYDEDLGNTNVFDEVNGDTIYSLGGGGIQAFSVAEIPEGTYNYVFETDVNADCNGSIGGDDFATCAVGAWGTGQITIHHTLPPCGIDIVCEALDRFEDTLGFTSASVVQWSGDKLIKPFAGGAFAALYELRLWIVALVVISIIVFFAFRAFRFYRR